MTVSLAAETTIESFVIHGIATARVIWGQSQRG
jgi:hypothetical protein